MRQKAKLRDKVLEIKEEVKALNKTKDETLKKLRELCEHTGNVTYWPEAWSEYTIVKYYQCQDCGLVELDQRVEHINTEGARRVQGKNRDLL